MKCPFFKFGANQVLKGPMSTNCAIKSAGRHRKKKKLHSLSLSAFFLLKESPVAQTGSRGSCNSWPAGKVYHKSNRRPNRKQSARMPDARKLVGRIFKYLLLLFLGFVLYNNAKPCCCCCLVSLPNYEELHLKKQPKY